jgi:hypothetical protein
MVKLFKRNLYGLENKVRDEIIEEMKNKFNRTSALGGENQKRFKDYRNQVSKEAAEFFSEANKDGSKSIEKMKERALDNNAKRDKTGKMMPYPIGGVVEGHGNGKKRGGGGMSGAILPEGFKHYSHCQCY